jgi:SAM-dependent methyltransferase
MSAPRCRYCGGPSSSTLHTKDRNRSIGSKVFTYYRCHDCHTLFLSPLPSDLGRYYPPDYHLIPSNTEQLSLWAEHERYKIDIVKRFAGGGSLIEIGPGNGGFAYLAKTAGFRVRVIEMDTDCCDFLARSVGVDVVNTTEETRALEASDPADVIALWHVAEHLDDPFALLRTAARKLEPGGIIVLAAPNPAALQFRILRSRWAHIDAPRHLYLIPPDVLRSLAEACGLDLLLQTTTDEGSLGWNRFGWQFSLASVSQRPRVRTCAMRVGGIVADMLRPLEECEGRGSAYTMVFARPDH